MNYGKVLFSRELDVKYEVDVFIAGGGPWGCRSLIGCTKRSTVFLAEGTGCLGGLGTSG